MRWAPRPVAWGVTDDVYWDLQVPRSPGGAFLGPPTHSGPVSSSSGWMRLVHGGSGCGAVGVHGGCPTASPHPGWGFTCPFALLWSGQMGRGQILHRGWRTHHLPWHPPRDLRLMPLLPALATAAQEPLLRPRISCQVLLNKYPRAMQGRSLVPPCFKWPHKPGPLCPSWKHYHLSPRGPSASLGPLPSACLAAAPAAPQPKMGAGLPGHREGAHRGLHLLHEKELGKRQGLFYLVCGHVGNRRMAGGGLSPPEGNS